MTIFVSIASYCDPLLFFTLQSCIEKAKYPQNLRFAVVDQNENSSKEKIDSLPFSKQIRYVYINKFETFGVCWARNIAFSLYDNETYLLQIDSHMYFEKDWDENLINQHNDLLKISKKPIISTYPYNFSFNEKGKVIYNKPSGKYVLELRPKEGSAPNPQDAVIKFHAVAKMSSKPINGCHLAGGFIFCFADFIEEVPYDPYLYFHGEEQSLSIRSYTKGWDIYHPTWIPLYHNYKKANSEYTTHHWHKSVESKRALRFAHLQKRAWQRLSRLIYGDGMKESAYGLGRVRSIQEYIDFSKIEYKKEG